MPSIYGLKPAFQKLLRPLNGFLVRAGVTANHVTLAALLLSFATGAALLCEREARWPLILIAPVLFIRMALNAIDGMLAREHNMKTPLGAILNELGDVLSDAALYLPLALRPSVCPWLMVSAVVLGIISEMTGVIGVQIGGDRRYDGPMGKSDRAFVFGAMALAIAFAHPDRLWLEVLLGIVNVLLIVTILNRARGALKKVTL